MSKKQKPASNVVVGGSGASAPSVGARQQKILVSGGVMFLALVFGIGTWYVVSRHNESASTPASPAHVFTSENEVYKSEAQKLDAELAAAKTPEQRSAILIKRANAELAAGRFSEAEVWGKKAVAAKPTLESYSMLGSAAVQARDKPTAVDAYKKAAALVRQQGGENAEQIALRLEAAATALP